MPALTDAQQLKIARTCALSRTRHYTTRFTFEDAVSEAWLGIQRGMRRHGAHGGSSTMEAWAGSYAVWAIRKAIRLDHVGCGETNERTIRKLDRAPLRLMADVTLEDGSVRVPTVTDEPTAEDRDEFLATWRVLRECLPDREAEAVALRFVLGLSTVAAAKAMGAGKSTASSHVAHARRRLRKRWPGGFERTSFGPQGL